MFDLVYVNINGMYELGDAMEQFRGALDTLDDEVRRLTEGLGDAMVSCSRMGDVSEEVRRALRQLRQSADELQATERDLLRRAAFLEEFDRGERSTGAWRDDRI